MGDAREYFNGKSGDCRSMTPDRFHSIGNALMLHSGVRTVIWGRKFQRRGKAIRSCANSAGDDLT